MKLPQKKSKKFAKWIPAILLPVVMVLFAWNSFMIPDNLTLIEGQKYEYKTLLPVSTSIEGDGSKVVVKAFGVVTQKVVDVDTIPETKVMVSGKPIGIKMTSEGVLVTGFIGFLSNEKIFVTPGRDCGLKVGDRIYAVGGTEVRSAEQFTELMTAGGGNAQDVKLEREGKMMTLKVTPCEEENTGVYRVGLWVKDSVAGIGTLTFYQPDSGFYGALGHGITDTDTGGIFTVREGILLHAEVLGVVKGISGIPGELRGVFLTGSGAIGNISLNNDKGIYGCLTEDSMERLGGREMYIGTSSMVKEGPATIYTTIDDDGPKEYSVEIVKVSPSKVNSTKGLVIKITDKTLLEKTGGIVQGMSGSPIVQNGRLIGAVTHVMINDPTSGYGVFIEGMLGNQQSLSQTQKAA